MQQLPLIALHLQRMRPAAHPDDFEFDDVLQVNIVPDGGLACSRATKPYTSATTPGHTIKPGYTPGGKYKTSKYVPSKMDKRAGK
ncbi:MAG: hypothetical protein ABI375_00365 [Rudaea sp.]